MTALKRLVEGEPVAASAAFSQIQRAAAQARQDGLTVARAYELDELLSAAEKEHPDSKVLKDIRIKLDRHLETVAQSSTVFGRFLSGLLTDGKLTGVNVPVRK